MSTIPHDIIDHLAGIESHVSLNGIRQLRASAREQAQQSFVNLFDHKAALHSQFGRQDRLYVAIFVALLHQQENVASFYQQLLEGGDAERLSIVFNEAEYALTQGPYGSFPRGPLSTENTAGITYEPSADVKLSLGLPLSAALRHAHLLVFHLRDASPHDLQLLLNAGWNTPDIVTLSQLVSFLSFQIRVIGGLRVLARATQAVAA